VLYVFKKEPDGDFLDNDTVSPTPPWASIRELQFGAKLIESNENTVEVRKLLAMLIAPGSSFGGARPKANIMDETPSCLDIVEFIQFSGTCAIPKRVPNLISV